MGFLVRFWEIIYWKKRRAHERLLIMPEFLPFCCLEALTRLQSEGILFVLNPQDSLVLYPASLSITMRPVERTTPMEYLGQNQSNVNKITY